MTYYLVVLQRKVLKQLSSTHREFIFSLCLNLSILMICATSTILMKYATSYGVPNEESFTDCGDDCGRGEDL
jgi:hypothetical protein